MFAFLPPCFKFIALIASEVSILDLSAVAAFHRSGGSIRLCVQHDTYRYLLTITDAFYQLSAFSLSLSLFCIVYVHRHWHVRINTQREREKTHTHTRTQTHTCAIGPKMHRLMKSSMRTHVCIMAEYITIYVYIYAFRAAIQNLWASYSTLFDYTN